MNTRYLLYRNAELVSWSSNQSRKSVQWRKKNRVVKNNTLFHLDQNKKKKLYVMCVKFIIFILKLHFSLIFKI